MTTGLRATRHRTGRKVRLVGDGFEFDSTSGQEA
jgi:hypothetical protein